MWDIVDFGYTEGVSRKSCSENMQKIYERRAMPKLQSNFIETTLWHESSAVKLLYIFRIPLYKNTYGWMNLVMTSLSSDYLH